MRRPLRIVKRCFGAWLKWFWSDPERVVIRHSIPQRPFRHGGYPLRLRSHDAACGVPVTACRSEPSPRRAETPEATRAGAGHKPVPRPRASTCRAGSPRRSWRVPRGWIHGLHRFHGPRPDRTGSALPPPASHGRLTEPQASRDAANCSVAPPSQGFRRCPSTPIVPPDAGTCYRAPRQLPGPDSHWKATTSFNRITAPIDVTSFDHWAVQDPKFIARRILMTSDHVAPRDRRSAYASVRQPL